MSETVGRGGGLALWWTWALGAVVLASCSVAAPTGALCGGGPCASTPKKLGHSLSETVLCRCQACEPASCCEEDRTEQTDDCPLDSYDFTASENCGLAVASCESRCFEHSWRADVAIGCSASRPDRCCESP